MDVSVSEFITSLMASTEFQWIVGLIIAYVTANLGGWIIKGIAWIKNHNVLKDNEVLHQRKVEGIVSDYTEQLKAKNDQIIALQKENLKAYKHLEMRMDGKLAEIEADRQEAIDTSSTDLEEVNTKLKSKLNISDIIK